MKKVYLDYFFGYPKDEIYFLANRVGRKLLDYLGDELFLLLVDSKILLSSYDIEKLSRIKDSTWKLHSASKSLEGFLNKLIVNKKLYTNKNQRIGDVFGDQKEVLKKKIGDIRLIAKTKSTWDYCRNDVMHYQRGKKYRYDEMQKRFEEIIEIMKLLYEDLYNTESKPDDEIDKGFKMYVSSKYAGLKYNLKERIIRLIRKI